MGEVENKKKTASEILIDRFLAEVDERGYMPWQKPYECYNSFNYFTMNTYRGINRLILPFEEYMTANQINAYNKEHNEDFRFQKGIKWYPVCFFKTESSDSSKEEAERALGDKFVEGKSDCLGYAEGWTWWFVNGKYTKSRKILRYYQVADRTHFKNSKGEMLPSRIETGEVEITFSKPKDVFDAYVSREGITVTQSADIPCYIPAMDIVQLNPYTNGQGSWFSTAFHELAHSTGHRNRLNRVGITRDGVTADTKKSVYAVEECIAEICASLCCAECGVYDFETSGTREYDNSIAYVQGWKKRIQDFGKEFIYICSQADKAFNYIFEGIDEEVED